MILWVLGLYFYPYFFSFFFSPPSTPNLTSIPRDVLMKPNYSLPIAHGHPKNETSAIEV